MNNQANNIHPNLNLTEQFTYKLSSNNVDSKLISNLPDFKEMLGNKNYNLDYLVNIISCEDFERNQTFQISPEELKLIKLLQYTSQYFKYSINNLQKEQQIIDDLYNQQKNDINSADELITKQKAKIESLENRNNDLNMNLLNMEFLLKSLNINSEIEKLNKQAEVNIVDYHYDNSNAIQNNDNIQEYKTNNNNKENNNEAFKSQPASEAQPNNFRNVLESNLNAPHTHKNYIDDNSNINSKFGNYCYSISDSKGNVYASNQEESINDEDKLIEEISSDLNTNTIQNNIQQQSEQPIEHSGENKIPNDNDEIINNYKYEESNKNKNLLESHTLMVSLDDN